MDIAALPISINQISQASSPVIGMAVLSMSLDAAKQAGANEIKMMEQSITPNLGKYIDLRV